MTCHFGNRFLVAAVVMLLTACGGSSGGNSANDSRGNERSSPGASPLPGAQTDFDTAHFSGADNCAMCHDGLSGSEGDFGFVSDWEATLMANAARDPLWQAKVASEVARNPDLSATIQAKCARCHTPMAHTENAFDDQQTTLLASEDGVLAADHDLYSAARDGVSCTLCHQIQPDGLGTQATSSGQYQILERSGIDRILFGSFGGVMQGPMQRQVAFTPRRGNHMQNSGLCGSCHNLKTTVVDPDTGQPVEPVQKFPEQAVYTEWEASAFADDGSNPRSCQDCHMPTTANAALSTRPPRNLPQRNGVSQHHFVGGNAYMLDLFQQNRDLLGIQASEAALQRTLDRTVASLGSAADVAVKNVSTSDGLQFDVTVTNNTGHKLPTSFPSRRLWLHVQVLDADGQVLFESGAPADDGSIEGVAADSDTDARKYERHHVSITAEGQVAVWEPIMKNVNEKVTYTLMEAADYAKDNRILADGMAKGSLPSEVAVHGDADSDPDFEAGQDTVTYKLAPGGTPNRIRVELLYQTVSYRFRRDLVTGTGQDSTEVTRFQEAHAKSRRPYETLVSRGKGL